MCTQQHAGSVLTVPCFSCLRCRQRTVGVWRRHLGRLEECRWIGNMIVRPKDEVVYRWWRPWSAHQGACAARSTSFMRSLGHAISSHYVYVNTLVHVAG